MIRVAAPVLMLAAASLALLSGCDAWPGGSDEDRPETSREFPRADRAVAELGGNRFSTETARDNRKEAQTVMDMAGIKPGMTVADIGAGEGYYTVRLAERVGNTGRVLAQDIDEEALKRLGLRVERERLDNVAIKPGAVDDPRLPDASFDRIFLVHMYHEVGEPYAFLWRLRPALKPGGQVIVVDSDRLPSQHGMPPELLFCEMRSLGFDLIEYARRPDIEGYFARFAVEGDRPAPAAIRPCRMKLPGKKPA